MSHLLKIIAVAAFVASGATLAGAQTQTTPSDSPSKAQPGAPDQGPGSTAKKQEGVGSAPIGPPTSAPSATTPSNPTGMSPEKKKSEQNDPGTGGKKQ